MSKSKFSNKKKLSIALLIISAATLAFACFHTLAHKTNSHTQEVPLYALKAFSAWTLKYNKTYQTPSERTYRTKVFYSNLKSVEQEKLRVSYQVGLTKFSDLTEEEFVSKYTGLKFSLTPKTPTKILKSGPNPASVDWREHGLVNDIRFQETCGSCYAYSAIASLESAWAQKTGKLMEFSEQQLVDCSQGFGNDGCDGGWMHNAFKYLKSSKILQRKNYPYENRVGTCRNKKISKKMGRDGVTSVQGYHELRENDGQELEDAVAKHGVISVAVQATTFMSYRGGIMDSRRCGSAINHGVSVVGYGSEAGKDFWVVRNQWGRNWGEGGYIRILKNTNRDHPGMCGINTKSVYPIV